jgi:hypothetical protein
VTRRWLPAPNGASAPEAGRAAKTTYPWVDWDVFVLQVTMSPWRDAFIADLGMHAAVLSAPSARIAIIATTVARPYQEQPCAGIRLASKVEDTRKGGCQTTSFVAGEQLRASFGV